MALDTDFSLGDTIALACSKARADIEHKICHHCWGGG